MYEPIANMFPRPAPRSPARAHKRLSSNALRARLARSTAPLVIHKRRTWNCLRVRVLCVLTCWELLTIARGRGSYPLRNQRVADPDLSS